MIILIFTNWFESFWTFISKDIKVFIKIEKEKSANISDDVTRSSPNHALDLARNGRINSFDYRRFIAPLISPTSPIRNPAPPRHFPSCPPSNRPARPKIQLTGVRSTAAVFPPIPVKVAIRPASFWSTSSSLTTAHLPDNSCDFLCSKTSSTSQTRARRRLHRSDRSSPLPQDTNDDADLTIFLDAFQFSVLTSLILFKFQM